MSNLKTAVKITGTNFNNGLEKVFYFSDAGFIAEIGGTEAYYEPMIKSSVIFAVKAESGNEALSIELINDNSDKTKELNDYFFDNRKLEIFVSSDTAPNTKKWYQMFLGDIKSFLIKKQTITIQAASKFNVFDTPINPATFSGLREEYEGEQELKGKNKPRLFGRVFNISPILLNSSKLIYGCNWGSDGEPLPVVDFSEVRDGGAVLTRGADYPTIADMDLITPAEGTYITCLAQASFKLYSPPVYSITCDVDQEHNRYSDIISIIGYEIGVPATIIQSSPVFMLGIYITEKTRYNDVNKNLIKGLDIANWFDGLGRLNIAELRGIDTKESTVRFIDSPKLLESSNDIFMLNIERVGYEKPPSGVSVGCKKNYTVQDASSIAGSVTERKRKSYGLEYLQAEQTFQCHKNIYSENAVFNYDTHICSVVCATEEAKSKKAYLSPIKEIYTITCQLLDHNKDVILGVIPEEILFVNAASTDILSSNTEVLASNTPNYFVKAASSDFLASSIAILASNAPTTNDRETLLLGDKITVSSDALNLSDRDFIVNGFSLNTKKSQITYTVLGDKQDCKFNIVHNSDNIVHGNNNIIHRF